MPNTSVGKQTINTEYMLSVFSGDRVRAKRMLNANLAEISKAMETLRYASAENDGYAIEQAAHFIRGAAVLIGAEQITALAFAVEKAAKTAERRAALPMLVQALRDALPELRVAVQAF